MDSHLLPHTGSPDPELQVHFPSIPTHSRTAVSLRCCCGREDCALLEHNHVALEGLEKDLETAARLGQVRERVFFYCFIFAFLVGLHFRGEVDHIVRDTIGSSGGLLVYP